MLVTLPAGKAGFWVRWVSPHLYVYIYIYKYISICVSYIDTYIRIHIQYYPPTRFP